MQLRKYVNLSFSSIFQAELIRQSENIAGIEQVCSDEHQFSTQIGILAGLVDDFDLDVLLRHLQPKPSRKGGINCLERFFEQKHLEKGNAIDNLRIIKDIRNFAHPYHTGTETKFAALMRDLGFRPPYEWQIIWTECLKMYVDALQHIAKELLEYGSRTEFGYLHNEKLAPYQVGRNIVYLNDHLHRYRILVPIHYRSTMEPLVDHLTAAVVSYEKGLKSVNHTMKRYVKPMKRKFRELNEDPYFVNSRRFVRNGIMQTYRIWVPRDGIGISSQDEFEKYFRYIIAAVASYALGISPDWYIRLYAGMRVQATSYGKNSDTALMKKGVPCLAPRGRFGV